MINKLSIHFIKTFALLILLAIFCQCNNQSNNTNKDECCKVESSTDFSESSEITCPECGFKKVESLPTDVCVIKYKCEKCNTELTPKQGDCCVFCTYGTHKCPSMQDE